MIDMDHVIPDPHGIQIVDRHPFGTLHLPADVQFVIALENLMVGIVAMLGMFVDIPFMKGKGQEFRLHATQDFCQAPRLAFIGRKDRNLVALDLVMDDVIGKQFEILGKGRLRQDSVVFFLQDIVP